MTRLDLLSRNKLLLFRVEVGRAITEELFDGDPTAFLDPAGNKTASLKEFARVNAVRLADIGLTEQTLRQCLLCGHVISGLPPELVPHLALSHIVELGRIADPDVRRSLATNAVANGWSSREIRRAVLAARAGASGAAGPERPPPPAPGPVAEKPPLPPGRVVTRFERSADSLADLGSHWAKIDVAALTVLQRVRVRDALTRLEDLVTSIRSRLDGDAATS